MVLLSPAVVSRDDAGRFRKGMSGNPRGGVRGPRRLIAQYLDQLAENEAEAVFLKVVEQAKAGDLDAAKIVLMRAWPVRRGRPTILNLPSLSEPGGATAQIEATLKADTTGELTPEEGEALSKVVAAYVQTVRQNAIKARIAAIEEERQQSRVLVLI